MRVPMNTYKGDVTSWGKLSVIASLIWFLFFKQRFPFSHMLPLFQDNFILVEATSSHFFRVTTLTQQLLFRDSCFFPLFQNSHFFAGVIFSEQLLFRSENSTEQHFLRRGDFLKQLLFGTAIFFGRTKKISKKELLFQSFLTALTFSEKLYFGKNYFSENHFPHYLLFLESCLFRAITFSKGTSFYNSYLFRRATFLQHTSSEELLFYSYGSFSQSHFLFIRQ